MSVLRSKDVTVLELTADLQALEARIARVIQRIKEAQELWDLSSIVRADRQDDLEEATTAMDQAHQAVLDAEAALTALEERRADLVAEISRLSSLSLDGESLIPEATDFMEGTEDE